MNLTPFDELSPKEKAAVLYAFGTYLLSVKDGSYGIYLFSLDNEFIELYFNNVTNKIEKVSNASIHDLDKFLEKISIR